MNHNKGSARDTCTKTDHDDVIKWKHFPRYWHVVGGGGNPSTGNTVTGAFPTQRPVTGSFDVFFDLHMTKRYVGDLTRHCAHYDVSVMDFQIHSLKYCEGRGYYFLQLKPN